MQTTEFVPDSEDLAILAFRLAWPGEPPARKVAGPRCVSRLAPARRIAARLIPVTLRRRFVTRRQLHGWPVALSVPGPESATHRAPSVKLTGRPLD